MLTFASQERSSAKCKLFRRLQVHSDDGHEQPGAPLQLLIDMKVRWSSTYLMLRRRLVLHLTVSSNALMTLQDVDRFVRHISLQERDADKRRKIMELELMDAEWERYAEKAQHAFSTEQGPTLHTALPALEALHKAWSSRKDSAKYVDFSSGLEASLTKVNEYYEQTATSDAHIMAMLLDPTQKLNHIRTYWGEEQLTQVLQYAEDILSDDEDNDALTSSADVDSQSRDPSQPWLQGFHAYLNTCENLGGIPIVQWWGINVEQRCMAQRPAPLDSP
ncbi:hypothetical protein EDD15DRAFT_2169791 [Pisolithus albus]|nr:hypothetical protein EDD15DRAFT_2169791 [Pisolithus albus]